MSSKTLTVDPAWRKSSHSGGNGACVEVAVPAPATVAVRDSKDPSGPQLRFSPEAWHAFAGAAGHGAFGAR
ncbi:DUF397 domain-containing protein [Kitasatospora sp. NBC_01287]|uniref:DUF397 domain-containing protein n=1 Tax=Kitasatospora sp. NBC_01287 TaxID=2903573 RepID=UPI002259719A|nr:DUF397 domain-containing protein [Kitasatospora sp. NBC_01287]MCX4747191.1 DUF397 domain-containing protein [Kitasatospora sp. NBC_01287]